MSDQTTVSRSDIALTEETIAESYIGEARRQWWARLDGPLSTGEHVRLVRIGRAATKALSALETAIAEQGWVIEDEVEDARAELAQAIAAYRRIFPAPYSLPPNLTLATTFAAEVERLAAPPIDDERVRKARVALTAIEALHPTDRIVVGQETHGGPLQYGDGCATHGMWCLEWRRVNEAAAAIRAALEAARGVDSDRALARVKANAWDEGHGAGRAANPSVPREANPYRESEVTE